MLRLFLSLLILFLDPEPDAAPAPLPRRVYLPLVQVSAVLSLPSLDLRVVTPPESDPEWVSDDAGTVTDYPPAQGYGAIALTAPALSNFLDLRIGTAVSLASHGPRVDYAVSEILTFERFLGGWLDGRGNWYTDAGLAGRIYQPGGLRSGRGAATGGRYSCGFAAPRTGVQPDSTFWLSDCVNWVLTNGVKSAILRL